MKVMSCGVRREGELVVREEVRMKRPIQKTDNRQKYVGKTEDRSRTAVPKNDFFF